MADTTFAFEQDFVASMRCIPMAVRMKLDLAGVKLSLKEWSKLEVAERAELLAAPADGYGDRARALVRARTGADPAPLPPATDEPWMQADAVPPAVAERAAVEGVNVSVDSWARLTMLQRFALVKLSRPSHENANFARALREFGLAKPAGNET